MFAAIQVSRIVVLAPPTFSILLSQMISLRMLAGCSTDRAFFGMNYESFLVGRPSFCRPNRSSQAEVAVAIDLS